MLPILEEVEIKHIHKIVQNFFKTDIYKQLKIEYRGVLPNGVSESIFMEMDNGLKTYLQHNFHQPLYCFFRKPLPPMYDEYRIFLFTEDELYDMTYNDVKHVDFWSYHFKSKDAFLLRNESILCMSPTFSLLKQIKKEKLEDLVLWIDIIGKFHLFKKYENEIELQRRLFPKVDNLNHFQKKSLRNAYRNSLNIAKTYSVPTVLYNDILGSNLFAYIPEDSFISIYEGVNSGILIKVSKNNT